jgi:uncharacterized repeat protein (TIGR03843 family)
MEESTSDQVPDESPSELQVDAERAVQLLSDGELGLIGPVLSSSNYTFLVSVDDGELKAWAIYKPGRGEIPLWDFPRGTLGLREVCAYLISQVLGWPLIPPIVLRNGPHGPGTVQLYIDADPEAHYFTLRDERQADLLPVALFDVLANNADRKGGHLLLDRHERIWAIDNALTFHQEPKLRTVVWDFAGETIPEPYLDDLAVLQFQLEGEEATLRQVFRKLLAEAELAALMERLQHLLTTQVFPYPDPGRRHVPWPLI